MGYELFVASIPVDEREKLMVFFFTSILIDERQKHEFCFEFKHNGQKNASIDSGY